MALTGPSREIIVEPITFPGPREIPADPQPAEQPEPVPVAPETAPANV